MLKYIYEQVHESVTSRPFRKLSQADQPPTDRYKRSFESYIFNIIVFYEKIFSGV